MGGVNSYCVGKSKRGHLDCPENHANPFNRKGHRRNLSSISITADKAPFHQDDNQLININTATEEELMTLPGINRATASNVVNYRRQIGGFRKVEDLALVTGVGGDKLSVIRNEITVGPKPVVVRLPKQTKVAINVANVFQLMKVKGISQKLAETIVARRDKYGPYPSLDGLLKVKGFDHTLLAAVKSELVLDAADLPATDDSAPIPTIFTAGSSDSGASMDGLGSLHIHEDAHGALGTLTPSSICSQKHRTEGNLSNHIKSVSGHFDNMSQLTKLSEMFSASQMDLLSHLQPLAMRVVRPAISEPFACIRAGRPAVRVGSWNLARLSVEKARNPGVREVICLTLLENGIALLAVQEVVDKEALEMICEELNSPTLPNMKRWSGPRGVWTCLVSPPTGRMFQGTELSGIIYDTTQKVAVGSSSLLEKEEGTKKVFTRSPFMVNIKIGVDLSLLLVSVHLKASGLTNEHKSRTVEEVGQLPLFSHAVKECAPNGQNVMIAGDFNLDPNNEAFSCLRECGYTNVITGNEATNISAAEEKGTKAYDNLWLSTELGLSRFTGKAGVVREGLSHPFIPKDSFGWNGFVSDHCPVWTEFFLTSRP